jgi:hypothetical protein
LTFEIEKPCQAAWRFILLVEKGFVFHEVSLLFNLFENDEGWAHRSWPFFDLTPFSDQA